MTSPGKLKLSSTDNSVNIEKDGLFQAAIFADTHGNGDFMEDVVNNQGPFDLLIHLGDGFREGQQVAEKAGIRFCGVCGNEDFGCTAPEKKTISINQTAIYLMHGHQLDVNPYQSAGVWKRHYADLARIAGNAGAGVLLFGHTHKQALKKEQAVLICNPGDHYRGSTLPAGYARLSIQGNALRIGLYKRVADQQWEEDQQITQPV